MGYRSLITGTAGLACTLLVGSVAFDYQAFLHAMEGVGHAGQKSPGAVVGTLLASAIHATGDADDAPSRVHLRVPPHDPLLVNATPSVPRPVPPGTLRASAFQYVSRVFSRPSKHPRAMGYVRRGMVLRARDAMPGPGCRGTWYSLAVGGVVCSSDGFIVTREARPPITQHKPAVDHAMPFQYAKVNSTEALRFYRIPSDTEEAEIASALEQDQRLPEVVQQQLDGIYLLALDEHEHAGTREFVRTVRGRYVRAQDLDPKPEPGMRGVLLHGDRALPYAFVYGKPDAPATVYRVGADGAPPVVAGIADNHARIRVLDERTIGGKEYVIGPDGLSLLRQDVRVARETERPDDVPAGARWIHVDLAQQVLVAYEGERPVFTTLVSSGKGEEHATPTGLYRIVEKHISTTMRGADPEAGVYEVEEVPWTMYYKDSFALHGAYWHDDFGQTRSHGCTNIAPVDARWLFYWTEGRLPSGWNALRNFKGTYVYFTGVADV